MSVEQDHIAPIGELVQVLRLAVGDVECCIPLRSVERVLLLVALEPVPSGPNYLVGLMNFRSRSVPVIDLGIRLGIQIRPPYGEETPLVLVSREDRKIGLVVDQVRGVETIRADALQLRSEFDRSDVPVNGTAVCGSRQLLILDLDSIAGFEL